MHSLLCLFYSTSSSLLSTRNISSHPQQQMRGRASAYTLILSYLIFLPSSSIKSPFPSLHSPLFLFLPYFSIPPLYSSKHYSSLLSSTPLDHRSPCTAPSRIQDLGSYPLLPCPTQHSSDRHSSDRHSWGSLGAVTVCVCVCVCVLQ
jgi:hypothetical protein